MVGILEQPITILRTNARLFPSAANRSVVSNDCKLAERKVTLSRHYSSCKGSTLLSHPINSTLASSDLSNWPFWISTAAHLQIPTGSNFPLTNFSSCVCESNCQGGFLARSGYTTNISELGTAGRKRGKRSHISEISSIRWLSSMTMECSRLGMMSAGLERLSGLAARPRVQNVEFGTFRSNSNSLFLFFSLKTRFNAMVRHNWHFNHICQQKMFVRNTPCLAIKPPLAMVNGRPFVRVNVWTLQWNASPQWKVSLQF